jgi:hypothetical protein
MRKKMATSERARPSSVRQPKWRVMRIRIVVTDCVALMVGQRRRFRFLGHVIQQECPDRRDQIHQKNPDIPGIARQCCGCGLP